MKTIVLTASSVIACLVAGCASQPPTELKNARTAYQDAANSPSAGLVQSDVFEAKKSLDVAERAFADNGDEPETRDLAYVAERKAIIARSKENTAAAIQQKKDALAEADRWKQQQAMATRDQLGQTKTELAQSQLQLESERLARVAAERKTEEALTRIKGMTTKQDQRGLVMTINGSVLFTTGKSELLPTARKRLDELLAAVKDDRRDITIVGHTDSVGSDTMNQQLSQKRADAVRDYLTTHGLPEDRVQAKGVGETEPIADNKSAEGRANNRRVEIILNGTAETRGTPQPGTGMQPPRIPNESTPQGGDRGH